MESKFATLGPLIFRNIVHDTEIFKSNQGPFHFNYMDIVNHYPMPIPLISSDRENAEILYDSRHRAHRHMSRQVGARLLYRQKFKEAERALEKRQSTALLNC
ncbi:hypothetical protein B0T17DRAFT_289173 [Bombardia bombarda]|uniref:Uncharacterized protein n=1 Tax=Bombardia bombarda TaxID=252184 RepID=A0AA39WTQ4_9PEZI|nr:hypothetical protein B0T17DRAFT_289173 [Bombardia bombarda]